MSTYSSSLLPRTIVWRRVDDDCSFEIFSLARMPGGYEFRGQVIAAEGGLPLSVDYRIDCDGDWITKSCIIDQTFNGRHKRLSLSHEAGSWLVDGAGAAALEGCTDVDLGVSPSTNTIPMNRLRLADGASAEIRAAWIKFPALTVTAAPQAYRRMSVDRYLYRNIGSSFKAEIGIDELGLVTEYEDIWTQIAVSRSSAV
jgi:hypothetical protein